MHKETPQKTNLDSPGEITRILRSIRDGDPHAESRLWEVVYETVHKIASHYLARDRARTILQTTAVVHETYLRISGTVSHGLQDRGHFYRTAALAIRRILIQWSRNEDALKRPGRRRRILLEDSLAVTEGPSIDLMDLDPALQRLSRTNPRVAAVVDMRFFGGLSTQEIATALDVSQRTVVGDLTFARARLHRELRGN